MAYIGVGGNTSVQWIVEAKNVRQTLVQSRGTYHSHEGIAESVKGDMFTIIISAPRGSERNKEARAAFYNALKRAIKSEGDLRLQIPIEDSQVGQPNLQQIQITWPDAEKPNPYARMKPTRWLQR